MKVVNNTGAGRPTLPLNDGGRKLREWRLANNLSVREVAARMGVSRVTYYRFEEGHPPTLANANAIVRVTHGSIRYRDLWPGFRPEYA